MTILRLARSELKRMTHGRLPKLAILAMTMVPLLYGAVYLYANWDPYGNMSHIKAALVVQDTGADLPDNGGRLDAGTDVADSLIEEEVFDWQRVATPEEADEGVREGRYSFALEIPADFSENLASPGSFDSAQQAMLNVTTNDANNYLLNSIVDKVTQAVHDSVAKEVGTETADKLLSGYGVIHQKMTEAADGAVKLRDGTKELNTGAVTLKDGTASLRAGAGELLDGQAQLVAGAEQLGAGADQLGAGATQLASGLSLLQQETAALPTQTQQLADGAAQVSAGNATLNERVQSAVASLDSIDAGLQDRATAATKKLVDAEIITEEQAKALAEELGATSAAPAVENARTQLHEAAGQVQQLADGAAQVSTGASKLAAATPALTGGIGQASTGANELAAGSTELASGSAALSAGERDALAGTQRLVDGAIQLDDGAAALKDGTGEAVDGASELASGLRSGAGDVPNPDEEQRENLSQVIADPVSVQSLSQAKAATYGAGLAPFFLSLSMWVGIFMLMQAMRPVTRRALASNAPSWKIALGGWLPFVAVSAAQATLLTLVVDFALGLNPVHPVLMWLFLLLGSFAFSAIIQGIVSLLGSAGKFVVLILLILQLVSSGGTFPWEMTPAPFRVAHDILPMGYVVNGMRHLIYGGDLGLVTPLVLGLLGYIVIGAALNVLGTKRGKTWTLKTLQPEISL